MGVSPCCPNVSFWNDFFAYAASCYVSSIQNKLFGEIRFRAEAEKLAWTSFLSVFTSF